MTQLANYLLYASLLVIWLMLFYHMFLMLGGYLFSLKHERPLGLWSVKNSELPFVSILIPAHNEEIVIENTIQSMVNLNYPKEKLEVIIINDNSSDLTGMIANKYAKKYTYIKVIHNKPPNAGKGKSGALNTGFKHSSGDIIVVYDADNTPEPDAVRNLVVPLIKGRKIGAVVGKFRVINAKKNILTRFINIETITFQWLAQAGRWYWFRLATIPGTNFAIRRDIIETLGGWDEKALAEDTEISIRVLDLGYSIRFFPSAITWEQEPEKWRVWWKQRTRWACGNMYVIVKYLFRFTKLREKKILIDLFYFLLTYFLFFTGILLSHSIFVLNLFVDLDLTIGFVSYALLIVGFLLFVTELLLALSIEKQTSIKNFFAIIFMYFTYSQIWLILVVFSALSEMKRMTFRRERKWYKTERYKQVS